MNIREAAETDLPQIVRSIGDFARFERLEAYLEVTEDSLREAIFGPAAFVECLIAEESGDAAGYALYYRNFSSFRGQPGFFLEDLYVDERFRGRGLGLAFLKEIARRGRSRGIVRIDFQVLEWNTPAIKFYEKLGAVRDDEERHFKFAGDAFALLTES